MYLTTYRILPDRCLTVRTAYSIQLSKSFLTTCACRHHEWWIVSQSINTLYGIYEQKSIGIMTYIPIPEDRGFTSLFAKDMHQQIQALVPDSSTIWKRL